MSGPLNPNSDVAARLNHVSARAGSAQQRILDYIGSHPTGVLVSSANAIGQSVNTSDATVIRTIQKLGYHGLKEFKQDLRAALDKTTPSRQLKEANPPTVNRRKNSARDIYSELRQMIMTDELTSGIYVTETELAARLGVSRTPIREALKTLERNQLIERGHQGIRVPAQSRAKMNEVYDAYILLESALVRRACERRTPAEVDMLRGLNATMRQMTVDGDEAWELARANLEFRETTWQIARDGTLTTLIHQLYGQLDLWPGTTLTASGRWAETLEEHDRLIEAIEARDATEAATVIADRLEIARRIRNQMISAEEALLRNRGGL